MNSYLVEQISQIRRDTFIAEAAAVRRAADGATPARAAGQHGQGGLLAAIRRLLAVPEADSVTILPRLADYPTARN